MAKYLKLKQLLAKMLNSPIIVEQGTEGIWTWRKWSDGKAECWGTTLINFTTATAWGGVYWCGPYYTLNFPTDLFLETPLLNKDWGGGIEGWIGNRGLSKDTIIDIYLVRGATASNSSYIASFHAIGKWAEINPTTQEMTATSYSQTQMTKAEIQALIEASGNQFKDNDTWIPSDLT